MNGWFTRFARWTGRVAANPVAFSLALLVIVAWAVTGPIFGFSDTWQLVINTGTTIVTFLMVFLIQNTQNRDTEAMHLKLDELIRAVRGANNLLINLEDDTDHDLDEVKAKYGEVVKLAREGAAPVTGTPGVGVSKLLKEEVEQEVGEDVAGAAKEAVEGTVKQTVTAAVEDATDEDGDSARQAGGRSPRRLARRTRQPKTKAPKAA